MAYSKLTVDKTEKHISVITLTRSDEMNTLSLEMMSELEIVLEELRNEDQIKVMILTGSGGAFGCGAKLQYMVGERSFDIFEIRSYLKQVQRLFNAIEDFEKPTIAAINGYALGGGCEMAIACDFRIMSHEAKIGVPEVRLGLLAAAGGVQRLPRLIGRAKALELNMLGTQISADEAERIGLVNKAVPHEKLMDEALSLANQLTEMSSTALYLIKASIHQAMNTDRSSSMEFGLEALLRCFQLEDSTEGINAFFEKRKPQFKGVSFGVNTRK